MILAILKMIGCLALLMFGMKTMSEGLQKTYWRAPSRRSWNHDQTSRGRALHGYH